jgi:hypothetical protein
VTNFKLLGVAAILSTIIATPVMAQPAVQEPGYRLSRRAWALDPKNPDHACHVVGTRFVCERASRSSAKHYARAHKMQVGPQ